MFPFISTQAPPYDETLDCPKFAYTRYWTRAYATPAFTDLFQSMLAEGEPIFAPALRHLQRIYPRAYTRASMSMLGPSRPDYKVGI